MAAMVVALVGGLVECIFIFIYPILRTVAELDKQS